MPDTQGTFLLVLHGCQLRGRASTSFGCRPTATRSILLVVRRRWAEACPACPASVHPVAERGARDGVLVGHPARRPRPRQLVARAARAGRRRAEPAVGGLWMARAWRARGVRVACAWRACMAYAPLHGMCMCMCVPCLPWHALHSVDGRGTLIWQCSQRMLEPCG